MPIPKIVKKQSTGEEVVIGQYAIDPGGNLVLVTAEDLKPGWRWASSGDIKAKEAAEKARVEAETGKAGGD